MSVCLSMIVKNEAHVLARALRSARPFIDAWVVVDTGSEDATAMIPRQVLEGMPGEVVHRTWKDFASNRNEALVLAWERADYALVLDADDELEQVVPTREPGTVLPELAADIVSLRVEHAGQLWWRPHFLRRESGRYVSKLHEHFVGNESATRQNLETIRYKVVGGGARSLDPDKWVKDARVLQAMLDEDPNDAHAAFYLAQALQRAGRVGLARDAFGRRIAMGQDAEEVWYSLFQLGELAITIGDSPGVIVDAFLWAYECRPTRAEPLRKLAAYLRRSGRVISAHAFDTIADAIPFPEDDALYLDPKAYVHGTR